MSCDDHTTYLFDFDHACSLEREEAEDLIKRHGGRVTGSVSKKTVISCISYFTLIHSALIHHTCN